MRFLRGTHNAFAEGRSFTRLMQRLGRKATQDVVIDGDHSFHVPARSGRTDAEVLDKLLDGAAARMKSSAASRRRD